MVYSAYHIIFGITTHSWWFFTIGIYYAILSIVRFVVLRHKGNNRFVIRFTGIMLMVLSLSLVGTVILAFVKDRGTEFPLVVMLAIAVYAFTKMTLATIKWIKARKSKAVRLITLRNISFADAFVSIFSLQRSMLVSFEGMSETEIRIMNVATGSAVCIIVFLLGFNLVQQKKIKQER
jgi:divalent metal cation (Fe/Co/Zn/Cd) transporter